LYGDEELSEEKQSEIKAQSCLPINLTLSLNDQEWIDALSFKFHDSVVTRVAYVNNELTASLSVEERDKLWNAEEPEEALPEGLTEEELKKKEDEALKKANEETEETQTMAKRRGAKLCIYGTGFIKNDYLMVRFTQGGTVSQYVKPVFKSQKKLCVELPDMGAEVELGTHALTVDVTTNGQ
jgi:hypothetical protein